MKKIHVPNDRSLSLKATNLLYRMVNQSASHTATVDEISDWLNVSHAEAVKIASELVSKNYVIFTVYGYAVNKAKIPQMKMICSMKIRV